MEIQGKVIQVFPLLNGVSKAGKAWQKQEFIIETMEQFPKKVCVSVFNPNQYLQVPQAGSVVMCSIDIESRPFTDRNGAERWSTEVRAWKIADVQSQQPMASQYPQQGFAPQQGVDQNAGFAPQQNPFAPQMPGQQFGYPAPGAAPFAQQGQYGMPSQGVMQ